MLKTHESYTKDWARQIELAARARSALDGKCKVNEEQGTNDLTIAEKMDGEMMQNNEMRKILSASFEQK